MSKKSKLKVVILGWMSVVNCVSRGKLSKMMIIVSAASVERREERG